MILVVAAIDIWLIVLFVQMAANVKKLREHIAVDTAPDQFSMADAKLAVLLHKEDQAYEALITRLFNLYHNNYVWESQYNIDLDDLQGKGAAAERMCKVLGHSLPEELRSFDAFKSFMKSN